MDRKILHSPSETLPKQGPFFITGHSTVPKQLPASSVTGPQAPLCTHVRLWCRYPPATSFHSPPLTPSSLLSPPAVWASPGHPLLVQPRSAPRSFFLVFSPIPGCPRMGEKQPRSPDLQETQPKAALLSPQKLSSACRLCEGRTRPFLSQLRPQWHLVTEGGWGERISGPGPHGLSTAQVRGPSL